jgi:lactate dehydrogenase-like 2-hydroxyacid dehydrogenase
VFSCDEIVEMSARVDAILPCHSEIFDAETVARLDPRVKIIANHSVGVDHCDLDALKSRGIVVTNTPDVLSKATAEIALLLMLAAARRAGEGDRLVRAGAWDSWSPSFMVGTQMTDKRLGIVGMGRVGQAFAKLVEGFDMEIHYYNRNRLPPEQERGAIYHETVEDLLPHCDFVSLHCPATPETENLMNAERLALLPDGAILVNTARGKLVDEDALIAALQSGKLAAAGLDVFKTEPGGNPAFAELDNIVMLPHIGSATRETRDAMGFRALDNLDAFFAGNAPRDRVA